MANFIEMLKQKLDRVVQRQHVSGEIVLGIVSVVILLCIALYQTFARQPSEPTPAPNEVLQAQPQRAATVRLARGDAALQPQQMEEIREAIQEHNARISANPYSDDVPGHFMALGNIHRLKLKEYESAMQYYQFVIDGYPDDRRVPQAYLAISQCYEQMGNRAMTESVYQEMAANLDPSSEYARLAKWKLQSRKGH